MRSGAPLAEVPSSRFRTKPRNCRDVIVNSWLLFTLLSTHGILAKVPRLHITCYHSTILVASFLLYRHVQIMASDAADPMEQGIDSGTSTLERKRPHDVTFRDEAPNADSKPSTPRKRVKHPETLGYQDVREFVPVGASFSTSVVPLHEAQNSGDDGPQVGTSVKADILNRHGISKVSGFDVAIQGKALVEGRRLLIRNLPPDTTEEDLKHFFEGYSMWATLLSSTLSGTDVC